MSNTPPNTEVATSKARGTRASNHLDYQAATVNTGLNTSSVSLDDDEDYSESIIDKSDAHPDDTNEQNGNGELTSDGAN